MSITRQASAALLFTVASATALGEAQAQEAVEDTNAAISEDEAIVVTARRRAENIQKVPVAVTAIAGETLQNLGALNNQDVARLVPSLYIGQGGFGSTTSAVALRGISNPPSNISFDPDIGIYVDEVYLARNFGSLFDYFDVSGVQVLRGVQGTLFGRNNVGGAVLVSTTKPKNLNEMILTAEYGNYDSFRASAVTNVAVVPDVLALRMGFLTHTRDGYSRNVATGERLNNKDSQTFRFSALLTPSANSEFQLTGEYSQHDESGPPFTPVQPTGRPVKPGLGFYEGDYDSRWSDKGDNLYLTGRGSVDLGAVQVKAIGNYLRGDVTVYQDVDATRVAPDLGNGRRTKNSQYSGEFQLAGKAIDNRLDWVTGLYYLHEKGQQPTTTFAFNSQTLLFIDNKTKAAYGHADFKITDRLQIGGGLRYTEDEKGTRAGSRLTSTGACTTAATVRITGIYDPATCLVALQKNNAYWSYDAAINFQATEEILLYFRTGKGQKSGGFNSVFSNPADLQGYEPEIAKDLELGIKSEFFDRRVRLNIAAFQTDYSNIQRNNTVVINVGGSPATLVTVSNAAKARIRGAEVELSARLTDALTFDGSFSHVDPKYLSFTSVGAGGVIDQRNFPFQSVSRYQGSASLNWSQEFASAGRFNANISYAYRSAYSLATIPDPLLVQPGYGLLNAHMRFEPEGIEGLEISAFIRNLTNEKYWTAGASAGTVRFAVAGSPRMYGVGLRYRFGD